MLNSKNMGTVFVLLYRACFTLVTLLINLHICLCSKILMVLKPIEINALCVCVCICFICIKIHTSF